MEAGGSAALSLALSRGGYRCDLAGHFRGLARRATGLIRGSGLLRELRVDKAAIMTLTRRA
jgi:hypothetical protein